MIVFRADGNSKIGAGHIMRCLSIADAAINMNEDVIFYTAGNEFSEIIENRRITNIVLRTDFMQMESELVLFKCELLKNKPAIVFVDSYFVTRDYLCELLDVCHSYGGKLVYIDDVVAFDYPCDILINYNIYGPDKEQDYISLYGKKCPTLLLGIDYVPLRKEFSIAETRTAKEKPTDVLVSTGGADTAHIALAITQYVSTADLRDLSNLKYHILIGAMNDDKNEIERIALKCDNIEVHFNVKDMLSLIKSCDIAVSAAGSTLYELCATQTPTITYILADNQNPGAEGFAKKGLMMCAGDIRDVGQEKLVNNIFEALDKVVNGFSEYKLNIKLGDGANKILEKILE